MKPQRIQLSRKAGFNLQEASLKLNGLPAVNCARPSRWGNPWKVGKDGTVDYCVDRYKRFIEGNRWSFPTKKNIEDELHGKNIACYCDLDQPCHCDILLKIANP